MVLLLWKNWSSPLAPLGSATKTGDPETPGRHLEMILPAPGREQGADLLGARPVDLYRLQDNSCDPLITECEPMSGLYQMRILMLEPGRILWNL